MISPESCIHLDENKISSLSDPKTVDLNTMVWLISKESKLDYNHRKKFALAGSKQWKYAPFLLPSAAQ